MPFSDPVTSVCANPVYPLNPFRPSVAVVLFAVLAVVAANAVYNGDGQPGCQTPEELSPNPLWRNNWDQTAYWRCETLGVNAVAERCDNVWGVARQAFHPIRRECVAQEEWEWAAPVAPPSEATPEPEAAPEVEVDA